MKNIFFILFVSFWVISCVSYRTTITVPDISSVKIDTLLTDKMSCRALCVDKDKVWYAATGGKFGYVSLINSNPFQSVVTKDNLKLEFRSIAQTESAIFILCVANPGLLYKIDKKTKVVSLVYEESHEKVFYDSMLFMDAKNGIAIGDPIEDRPSIIKTTDGGSTWKKITSVTLPKFEEGEAFFAASNTNILYRNNILMMVSGGKKSRFYISKDRGETWATQETPIIQGGTMTGVFTCDFYDSKIGIIAGGNYEKVDQNFQNKAVTEDGGKSWRLVSENSGFGYASCVQYVPNSGGKAILEMGANGIFYSRDSGNNWKKISDAKDFIAFRFVNHTNVVASGRNRIVKMQLQ